MRTGPEYDRPKYDTTGACVMRQTRRRWTNGFVWAAVIAGVLFCDAPSRAQTPDDAASRAQAVLNKSVDYLKSRQNPDGGWQNPKDPPAMTALVLKAIVLARPADRQADYVKKG